MSTEVNRLYLLKSEIRIPKSKQIRMTEIHKIRMFPSYLKQFGLGIVSEFEFRI